MLPTLHACTHTYRVADLAIEQGIPVSIDAEKDRPHFLALLPKCDIVFTNAAFPKTHLQLHQKAAGDGGAPVDSGGSASTHDELVQRGVFESQQERKDLLTGMCSILDGGRAKMVVTSLGAKGAVLLVRPADLAHCEKHAKQGERENEGGSVGLARQLVDAVPLEVKEFSHTCPLTGVQLCGLYCPAMLLQPQDIVDTTGAGDAFIGGFLSALVNQQSHRTCLKLGTLTATHKLRLPGARKGLPMLQNLDRYLPSREE